MRLFFCPVDSISSFSSCILYTNHWFEGLHVCFSPATFTELSVVEAVVPEGEEAQVIDHSMHSIMSHLTGLMDDERLPESRSDNISPFARCPCCLSPSGSHAARRSAAEESSDGDPRAPMPCGCVSCQHSSYSRSPQPEPGRSMPGRNSPGERQPGSSGWRQARQMHFLHPVSVACLLVCVSE